MSISTKKNQIPFELRTNEISVEELRELDSFKNYNEEQAMELLRTIKSFTRIIYNTWGKEDDSSNRNTKTIEVSNYQQQNKAA